MKLTWPRGLYGLPKTNTGCPEETGFEWVEGARLQATESKNEWSSNNHFDAGLYKWRVIQKFCIKSEDSVTDLDMDWPAGVYCIYKVHSCPSGK